MAVLDCQAPAVGALEPWLARIQDGTSLDCVLVISSTWEWSPEVSEIDRESRLLAGSSGVSEPAAAVEGDVAHVHFSAGRKKAMMARRSRSSSLGTDKDRPRQILHQRHVFGIAAPIVRVSVLDRVLQRDGEPIR